LWRTLIRALAVASVLLVAGCGGGGSDGDGDPASLVPADALVYGEAVVRPEGDQREAVLEAARKVLRTDDPEAKIAEWFKEASSDDLDYARDIEPWLGERVAAWASPRGAEDNPGVVMFESEDHDAAREAVRAGFEREGEVTDGSHGDVDYIVGPDGNAAGVVGDFLVAGPEADLKRAIDASEGDSLADTDEYADAVDALTDDRIAHFWLDMRDLIELAQRSGEVSESDLQQLRTVFPLDRLEPIAGSFTIESDRLAFESIVRGDGLGALFGSGTPLVQELPGDSWAVYGIGKAGETVKESLGSMGGGLGGAVVKREFEKETGLDLDRDLLSWIGDAAAFVRGTTLEDVEAGLIIQPTDESRAAQSFGKIVGALQVGSGVQAQPASIEGAEQAFALRGQDVPAKPIILARGSGLVVLTYGEAAAEAALSDDDRLGDTDLYGAAEDLVGMEPSLLVSMPQVLQLVDATGSDPEFEQARPYIEAFELLSMGVLNEDDRSTTRVAAKLR
jgi:Protein of unknown function (DUF3352)